MAGIGPDATTIVGLMVGVIADKDTPLPENVVLLLRWSLMELERLQARVAELEGRIERASAVLNGDEDEA